VSFTGLGELASLGEAVITRFFPDADDRAEQLYKLKELEQKGDLTELNAFVQLLVAQTEINKIDAASKNWFQAGWRPFLGWIGGIAFGYAAILEPLLRFVASVYGYTGGFPVLDTTITMQVLMGLLGLSIQRSWEKSKGVI
jgi:hypothetical protein